MKKLGLIVNSERDEGYQYTAKTVCYLKENGFDVYLNHNIPLKDDIAVLSGDDFFKNVDAVITLGGDGTLLRVAEKAARHQTPILGINLGHLGYLAQLEKDDLSQLSSVLNKDTNIEQRFMLRVRVVDKEQNVTEYFALNDATLGRQIVNNMLKAKLYSNGEFVYEFGCDGLIFATPTGSTAYSMSSGGPIADCSLQDIVIFTPVCEHSFFSKSMIFSANDVLSCKVTDNAESSYLIIDGKTVTSMENIKEILIDRSPYTLPLLQPDKERFYKVLNNKFSAGGNV